jgi:hypothetical protein
MRMRFLPILLAAFAVGVLVFQARSAPDDGPSVEAKSAFVKKCFRDRTKAACDAPPQARLTH